MSYEQLYVTVNILTIMENSNESFLLVNTRNLTTGRKYFKIHHQYCFLGHRGKPSMILVDGVKFQSIPFQSEKLQTIHFLHHTGLTLRCKKSTWRLRWCRHQFCATHAATLPDNSFDVDLCPMNLMDPLMIKLESFSRDELSN